MLDYRVAAAVALSLCPPAPAMAQATRPAPPAASALPPLSSAEIDDQLSIGGTDIGGRTVDTRMTVPVRVDGHGPFPFVVDSGADTSVIGLRRARELRLPESTPVVLHGITATSTVGRVHVDRLDLGPSTLTDLELPALADKDLGGEGLIGIDALVEQRLMLDFDQHLIRIEDAHRPAPVIDGEVVVVARRRRGQLILTQARANGRPVDAVIDTGSQITIGNIALRDQLVRRHAATLATIATTGVTGVTINLEVATVGELRLGSLILRGITIAFADVPPFAGFGLVDHPAMLLGTDLMSEFRRVSLDFRARKVRFQLRRCGATDLRGGLSAGTSASSVFLDNDPGCHR